MRKLLTVVMLVCVAALTGCGGGNNGSSGMTGVVSVSGEQSASDFSSDVSFTITYTNPYRTSIGGVPINWVIRNLTTGAILWQGAENYPDNGTNTGTIIRSVNVSKTVVEQTIRCEANTGNLYSSSHVRVEPLDALDVTPATQEFSETDLVNSTKEYNVSGGSGDYSASSSKVSLVTVSVSGSTVIATRKDPGTGAVTITVTDNLTGDHVDVQATLVEIP